MSVFEGPGDELLMKPPPSTRSEGERRLPLFTLLSARNVLELTLKKCFRKLAECCCKMSAIT